MRDQDMFIFIHNNLAKILQEFMAHKQLIFVKAVMKIERRAKKEAKAPNEHHKAFRV